LICLPLTEERCDELNLPPQVADNTSHLGTAFTISIEARRGVTTESLPRIARPQSQTPWIPGPGPDLARPDTSFPCGEKRCVLVRPDRQSGRRHRAHCRALSRRCHLRNLNEDGTMARLPQLRDFAVVAGLKIITVADLVRYA